PPHLSMLFFLCFSWNRRPVSVFFFQAEDGIRDDLVTGVQTCALPILFLSRDRTGIRVAMPQATQAAFDARVGADHEQLSGARPAAAAGDIRIELHEDLGS